MKIIYLSLDLLSFQSMSSPVLDIKSIAGKTEKEVSLVLGEPVNCKMSKYGRSCNYKKFNTEVVYINKKSDWITLNSIDVHYDKRAIEAIGLPASLPTSNNKNAGLMVWDVKPFREISIFAKWPKKEKVDYFYIKTSTK